MGLTRSFVAIDLPEQTRAALSRIPVDLPRARIVDGDSLHLTLAFLGAIEASVLEEVHDALSGLRAPGFQMKIERLGCFGRARPRALWAGVVPDPALKHLQSKVSAAVRAAGTDLPRRRFVPHVTLARFASGAAEDAPLTRLIAAHAGLSLSPFPVRSFALFASHLGAHGAEYEELARYPLR